MQLKYTVTEQDFVDYNMDFIEHDKGTQQMIHRTQLMMVLLVLVGGTALMSVLHALSALSIAVYLALAAGVYFYLPMAFKSKVRKNVHRTIRRSNNKDICGEKTLTITEDSVNLSGENENSTYPFEAFDRVAVGARQLFLHLDDITALIIPNAAFADDGERRAFVESFEEHIQAAKAKKS